LRHDFLGAEFGSFPLTEFLSVLDHLFLASQAMPAVLFVGFLKLVQSRIFVALVQVLLGLLKRFQGLFIGWQACLFLGQDGRQETQEHQAAMDKSH
jgi:hypothetical protein